MEDGRTGNHLTRRVLERLGLPGGPRPHLDALRAFYRAWCHHVPFDNVRKLIALRRGDDGPLPGGAPDDFLEHWLAHGTGGTCWPSNNALFAVARALGFDARRVACSMLDTGDRNHGTTVVRIDGADWMVDSSFLLNDPLPLGAGVYANGDPVFAVEVEHDGGTHLVWAHRGGTDTFMPCRLLTDPVDHDFCLKAYEASRAKSPFNERLYVRRNVPGAKLMLIGRTRCTQTAGGIEMLDLTRDGLCAALVEDFGMSPAIVEAWAVSGALEANFGEAAGYKPPPIDRKPPSQR